MKISSRSLLKIVLSVVTVLTLALGIYIAVGGTCESPFTRMYHVRAEFSQLPENDLALEEQLLKLPGVYKAIVRREGKTISIHIIARTTALRRIDLPAELEKLGYQGMKSYDPDFREPVK